MPIHSRRLLRESLGLDYLRDTVLGRTSGSWGVTAGSLNIVDSSQADPTASGEQMYYRHWLRLLGSAGMIQDLRVGSFNTGTGAFVAAITAATTIFSGMPFEVHGLLSPAEKDRALDTAISRINTLQEIPIWATPLLTTYSIGPEIVDIADVRIFSDPTGSLDRGESKVSWWKVDATATGRELRIDAALLLSQQLVLNAITTVSLGSGDLATVNLPSDEWALWGAAAQCLWLVEQRAPAQEVKQYKARRQEAAGEFTRLSARFQPKFSRKVQLDEGW